MRYEVDISKKLWINYSMLIEAKNREEAEEKAIDGDFIECDECDSDVMDTEINSIREFGKDKEAD